MYYEQSGTKSFIIAFVTSLVVSLVVNILFIFVLSGVTPKFGGSVEIPNLKGLDVESARQIIESKGLTLIIEKEVEDQMIEKGKIVYQNPIMGSKLKKGDIVKVIVSKREKK
jgi:beta-lactam-binding protein with PASTA domain